MRTARLLILLAATLLAACSHKGKVREPAKLQDIENPAIKLDTAWTASAGSGSRKFSTGLRLVAEGDGLFAADIKGRVYAYDVKSGKRLWATDTDATVISGPSVASDMVLVGTQEGSVIALRRADGSEIWRREVSSEVLAPPVSDGDLVVARAVDGRVYGMEASNGDFRWSFDRTVPELVLRGLSEPLLASGRVLVGLDNGRVVAVRTTDGQVIWEQPVAVSTGANALERLTDIDAALVDGLDCLYAASFGGEVACLDFVSSQIKWRRSIKTYNNMAVAGDKLIVTDEVGTVWALDAETGAAAWKQEALSYRKLSPPAYFGGYVVVGDYDGYLHWIDPSDGHFVARSRAGSTPIVTQPVVFEDTLYVMNKKGHIAAIKIKQ